MKTYTEQGTLKTTIVCSEDKSRVFEICRDFSDGKVGKGAECLLITLYPTVSNVNKLDLSGMHYQNHIEELGITKTHFLFLFSKVCNARMSTRGIAVDSDNLDYVMKCIEQHKDAKVIIAWGESGSKNNVILATKAKIIEMIKRVRPDDTIWQLSSEYEPKNGKSNGNKHVLYMGIRCRGTWRLEPYCVPDELCIDNQQRTIKKEVQGEKKRKPVNQKRSKGDK